MTSFSIYVKCDIVVFQYYLAMHKSTWDSSSFCLFLSLSVDKKTMIASTSQLKCSNFS